MDTLEPLVRSIADAIGIITAALAAIGGYFMLRFKVSQHAERIEQINKRLDIADEKREELRNYVVADYVRRDFLDKIEANLSERIRDLESIVRSSSSEALALLRTISREVGQRRD